jgi:hypothetical protein
MRGLDSRLQLLLAFASVVFLGSESLWTRDHNLLSHFHFLRNLRLQGHGGIIRPRLHTGLNWK